MFWETWHKCSSCALQDTFWTKYGKKVLDESPQITLNNTLLEAFRIMAMIMTHLLLLGTSSHKTLSQLEDFLFCLKPNQITMISLTKEQILKKCWPDFVDSNLKVNKLIFKLFNENHVCDWSKWLPNWKFECTNWPLDQTSVDQ